MKPGYEDRLHAALVRGVGLNFDLSRLVELRDNWSTGAVVFPIMLALLLAGAVSSRSAIGVICALFVLPLSLWLARRLRFAILLDEALHYRRSFAQQLGDHA